jgi:serine/threonine protein kinase
LISTKGKPDIKKADKISSSLKAVLDKSLEVDPEARITTSELLKESFFKKKCDLSFLKEQIEIVKKELRQ